MPDLRDDPTYLTDREIALLYYVARGLDNRQIAGRMSLTIDQVLYCIAQAKRVLGARSRPHLAALWYWETRDSEYWQGKGRDYGA